MAAETHPDINLTATIHHLPVATQGPKSQGNWRAMKRAGTLPANVQPLRLCLGDMPPPETRPLSPEGYVLLALIQTLNARKGCHRVGEETFQAVVASHHRWTGDRPVQRGVADAVSLLCARSTGRR